MKLRLHGLKKIERNVRKSGELNQPAPSLLAPSASGLAVPSISGLATPSASGLMGP